MPETQAPVAAAPSSEPVAPPAQVPPAPPEAPPEPKLIPEDEAKRRESAVAAAARHAAENEAAEAKRQAADLQKRLDAIEKERKATDRATLSETDQVKAALAEREAEVGRLATEVAKRDALLAEVKRRNQSDQVTQIAKQTAPNLPPFYHDQLRREFAEAGDLEAEAVAARVKALDTEWNEYLQSAGLRQTPVTVGSPGNPPAAPQPDTEAETLDLIARSKGSGPDAQAAAAELQKRFQ
jgi:hypothetical protein